METVRTAKTAMMYLGDMRKCLSESNDQLPKLAVELNTTTNELTEIKKIVSTIPATEDWRRVIKFEVNA